MLRILEYHMGEKTGAISLFQNRELPAVCVEAF